MTQNRSNPFQHAYHNYKASKELQKCGGFDDWVITTAFYSAMKYLEDKLFPAEYEHPRKYGEFVTFKNYPQFISAYGRLGADNNKHRIMSEMVAKHIDDIAVVNSYEDLRQSCHTARYINYEVGQDRLNMAVEALEIIKNHCV